MQGATQAWDNAQEVPYAYNQGTWVGYDNVQSYQIKVQSYVLLPSFSQVFLIHLSKIHTPFLTFIFQALTFVFTSHPLCRLSG